eukprot:3970728-Prymnesium_polylepis.1
MASLDDLAGDGGAARRDRDGGACGHRRCSRRCTLGLKLCRKKGSSGTDVQTSQPISKHIGG